MDLHVTPFEDGAGWNVQTVITIAESQHSTQAEAEDRARELLGQRGGGELTVHGKDGQPKDPVTIPGHEVEGHMPSVHVTPHTDEGWMVVDDRVGRNYVDSTHATQAEASARARTLLEENIGGGDLVLHGQDGKVRDTTHVDYKNPEET